MKFSLVLLVCLVTTTDARDQPKNGEGCGETSYYGPTGIISSPNFPGSYNNSLYCDYNINTTNYYWTNNAIAIIFKAFNTEACCDNVTISCLTNSSYSPVTYSGYLLPQPVSIPYCYQGRVNFRSDSSTTSTGFMLDYYLSYGGCGNTVHTESHGYITSPNYPKNYDDYKNCTNIIWTPQQSSFSISFLHMNIEDCCDFVELSCLDNPAYGNHRFTGDTIPPTQYISQCTQVLVWFFSDYSIDFEGFNLEYSITPDSGTTRVTAGTMTLPSTTLTPSESAASPNTTTAKTTTAVVPQNCGDTSYYGPSGVISSPNYPGNYANDLSCDYYVNASSLSSSIAIIFETLDTEECCDYVTISCLTNPIYPSGRYSGSTLPQPLSIPWCSAALVNFITDSSTVSTGFSLDYHISLGGCGDTVYTGSNGEISSPNYPNSYDNNQNCSNIIWTRLRSSFSITFLYMNVEECCDFVELSCLDNAEYGSHRFTGTTIPPKQDIPRCTQVLVWFYTDDTTVHQGFNLDYSATPDSDDHR